MTHFIELKSRLRAAGVNVIRCAVLAGAVLAGALCLSACTDTPEKRETPTKKDETTTVGTLTIHADEAVAPLIEAQVKEFTRVYPEAKFTIESVPARRAIEKLVNGESRFIVVSRKFTAEEDSAAKRLKVDLVRLPVALDAVSIIVNPENPVENLRLFQFKNILAGKTKDWSDITFNKEKLPIQVFITGKLSSQRAFLQDSLLHSDEFAADAYPCSTSAQMKEYVKKFKGAIGYLSMIHARPAIDPQHRDTSQFRVVRLQADSLNAPSYLPYQQYVFDRDYALAYPIYIYYPKPELLPLGFAAFLRQEGQKYFQYSGVAPLKPVTKVIYFGDDK